MKFYTLQTSKGFVNNQFQYVPEIEKARRFYSKESVITFIDWVYQKTGKTFPNPVIVKWEKQCPLWEFFNH